jgi:low temperature requirement protein LtrA
MVHDSHHGGLLRTRDGGEQRATPLELFFDLVYVFAITQLSHLLLDHLTVGGALETLFLLLAVWWAWVYTTWVTNWFDPDCFWPDTRSSSGQCSESCPSRAWSPSPRWPC